MRGNELARNGMTETRRTRQPSLRFGAVLSGPFGQQAGQGKRGFHIGFVGGHPEPPPRQLGRGIGADTICVDQTQQILRLRIAMFRRALQIAQRRVELFGSQRCSGGRCGGRVLARGGAQTLDGRGLPLRGPGRLGRLRGGRGLRQKRNVPGPRIGECAYRPHKGGCQQNPPQNCHFSSHRELMRFRTWCARAHRRRAESQSGLRRRPR